MTRPLIGLTGRRKKGRQIVGNLAGLEDADIDMYYCEYTRAVLAAGGVPVHLPLDVAPVDVVGRLDGLLMSGGTDIDPDRYGQESAPELIAPEAERDDFEFAVLDQAAELGVPTLGICRGLQVINVHAGGTLHQHVPEHAGFDGPVDQEIHQVVLESDSKLGALYGGSRSVNSLHHQTVDQVGTDLRVTARGDDGGVEGLEHTSLPWIAVQWHPEMMKSAAQDPVFGWLVEAASA